MKIIMLIHVKMPTVVGILTFISIINTTCMKSVYFPAVQFYDQYSEISCSFELSTKKESRTCLWDRYGKGRSTVYTLFASLQIRVRICLGFYKVLSRNTCCGYSKEPSK